MGSFYTYKEKFDLSQTQKDWKKIAHSYWPENDYLLTNEGEDFLVFEFRPADGSDSDDVHFLPRRVEIRKDGEFLRFTIEALDGFRDADDDAKIVIHCLFDAETNGMKDILSGFLDYSEKDLGKWHARIAVLILVLLVLGFGGHYFYEKFMTPKSYIEIPSGKVASLVESQKKTAAQVLIVPFGGTDRQMLLPIAARLSEDLGIAVKLSPSLPVPKTNVFNTQSGRFDVQRLGHNLANFANSISLRDPNGVVVGVIDASIESSETSLNEILFAYRLDKSHAIVATHELGDMSVLRGHERLYKMIKRSIGGMMHDYPNSIKRSSLMYTPVRDVSDIDRMGYFY